MTVVQRTHFRTFLRSALDNNIHDEVNYYLENLADWHFSEDEIESGLVKELLFEESQLVNITFTDEWKITT